jgi:dTDP-3-amino-2,3,6-trideoxy-4-keto-D-glucose/dTDP-3-amino-3,4,6-trideoxy-alpha-D-glucose/dTDP-2,6-dideoxy-D-kanosamine transaminase
VVPVIDLSRHGLEIAERFAERAVEVTRRGVYLLGPETEAFENELARWVDAPHAVAVSSGASALQLGLAAAGVGPGDEVLVPAFTAVPTAAAVAALGATPVPVDVERDTANLDPTAVGLALTERTRAVVVVHLYGRPATIPDIDPGIAIVEDAAQAIGAVAHGSRSTAVCYSFYPTKNLGGIGDGGAIVTHHAAVAEQVRQLRVHGMTDQYVHESVAQNFRMSELEAAWLRLGLVDLAGWTARRREIAARLRAAAPQLRWQASHPHHVHHLVVARFADRDVARSKLATLGVATAVHYPLAITQQPAYRSYRRLPCPHSEAWAAECVTLPCFPQLTEAEVERVEAALSHMGPEAEGDT